jgi:hypothetical protein
VNDGIPLEEAKARLTIPILWKRLGLPGESAKSCRSPFREDRSPSFSVFADGQAFFDFGRGEGGDQIPFLAQALGISKEEAFFKFLEMAGPSQSYDPRRQPKAARPQKVSEQLVSTGPLPYRMTPVESARCRAACERLAGDTKLLECVAKARKWKLETIRDCCLDMCLGWENGRLAFHLRERNEAPLARGRQTLFCVDVWQAFHLAMRTTARKPTTHPKGFSD